VLLVPNVMLPSIPATLPVTFTCRSGAALLKQGASPQLHSSVSVSGT
jgi:hypothetical protein